MNHAPILQNAIVDRQVIPFNAFSLTVPANTFSDSDPGDSLTYSTTLDNGNSLPGWLAFDANTRTFSGTPSNSDAGRLNIKIIATDEQGLSASDTFQLDVLQVISGTSKQNNLTGMEDSSYFVGLEGRDFMTGMSGNDVFVGGSGGDTLIGGAGNDRFIYTSLGDIGDAIEDFEVGKDKIVLTELLKKLNYFGSDPIGDGYVTWIQRSQNTSIRIDPDGISGSSSFRSFISLENISATTVSASDFEFLIQNNPSFPGATP